MSSHRSRALVSGLRDAVSAIGAGVDLIGLAGVAPSNADNRHYYVGIYKLVLCLGARDSLTTRGAHTLRALAAPVDKNFEDILYIVSMCDDVMH